MAAWAVDREFCLYSLGRPGVPGASFGTTLGSLWLTLGCLGLPLTVIWGPCGRLGAPVGSSWGAFGCLGVLLGTPWGHFGLKWRFGRLRGTPPQANGSQVPRLRIESSLPELCAGSGGSAGNGVRRRCSDPTSTHAGGQDDVS